MKFYKRSRIIIVFAIIAIGLVVYIGLRSMRKEGMTPPPRLSQVTYAFQVEGKKTRGILNRTGESMTWRDRIIDENSAWTSNIWLWDQIAEPDENGNIYFVSNRDHDEHQGSDEKLTVNVKTKKYIWQPDPNKNETSEYEIIDLEYF
jgi:hypothetical protein